MHFSIPDSALEENQFVQGFLDVEQESWDDFASSWNHLESDRFMADGGKYRFRRYSEFDVVAGTKSISIRPHVPYSQPKAVNHLNGGIQRHYEAIEGRWFQPLREAAQRFCECTSQYLSGDVRWVLRPGRATTSSIVVKNPLYLRDRELWERQLSQSSIRANVLPI